MAISIAGLSLACAPAAAVAENTSICHWPALEDFLPTADKVASVKVVRAWRDRGDGLPHRFTVEPIDTLVGHLPARMSVRTPVADGLAGEMDCPVALLDVAEGDRLVIAFGDDDNGVTGRLTGVAFLSREPTASDPHLPEPGMVRTTMKEVRAILSQSQAAAREREAVAPLLAVLRQFLANLAALI